MILPGQAIMVYPADTTFKYTGNGDLTVTIPADQGVAGAERLHNIPFMSEGLLINDYNPTKDQGAGYDKTYNIKMKQIATQYTVNMNWTGDKINTINALKAAGTISTGMSADKVTLIRPTNKFTVEAPIKLQVPTSPIGASWATVAGNSIDTWNMESYVDKANPTTQENSLSSKEITAATDGKSATVEFLLLPQVEKGYLVAPLPTTVTPDNDGHTAAEDANDKLVIETYYGNIVIDNTAGKIFSHKNTLANDEMKLSWAYDWMVKNSHREKSAPSTFAGEEVGAHGTLNAAIDLNYLDMEVVHIKNDQQLRDMIHVHEALLDGQNVTFTIDGDANEEFAMSVAAVELLKANPNISIKLCEDAGEVCKTIRLTTVTNSEVPSFSFLIDPTFDVTVILSESADASWLWNGETKTMVNVDYVVNAGTLDVTDGAKINVQNTTSTPAYINLLTNNGTVNISGKVTQNAPALNNGIVNINSGAVYRVNAVKFINDATTLDKYGVINNKGYFGVVDESAGTIDNYGLIKQAGTNARTFITTNAIAGTTFATPFNVVTYKMGTIELKAKDDNDFGVQDATLKGFIKWTVKDVETVTAEEIGTQANYVVIEGKTSTLDFTRNVSENVNVLYVEFKNIENEVMWNTENTIIRGLIVDANSALYIQKGNKVEVSQAALVKGTVTKGNTGALTVPSYIGYLGGLATDVENVLTTTGN